MAKALKFVQMALLKLKFSFKTIAANIPTSFSWFSQCQSDLTQAKQLWLPLTLENFQVNLEDV